MVKSIQSALISVFDKSGLEPIVRRMHALHIVMYSTGGTREFIESLGLPVIAVEELTGYPSILGGRVKTLHPKIFGAILYRRDGDADKKDAAIYEIPAIDCVVVDLYPFEQTVLSGASHEEVIEKIDIGGISLIRGAAKNYNDVVVIPSQKQYDLLSDILSEPDGKSSLEQRRALAQHAFDVSSHYDGLVYKYFLGESQQSLKISIQEKTELRYGENPHQRGIFYGNLDDIFDKLNGKELSYNNLLDVDAAIHLIDEFNPNLPTFCILKHNNACGVASRQSVSEAYTDALACDPQSAFGGVLIANSNIDLAVAEKINSLFFEVLIAPAFELDALKLLSGKVNRILLKRKDSTLPKTSSRTLLNGMLYQEKDARTEQIAAFKLGTTTEASAGQLKDLEFANKIAKHTKSNTIVLVKNLQLCASGTGQTSRIDALTQAITKAQHFKFDLQNAVMASDAFFPFPDCVEIASQAGISAVVQPGGSIKDQLSIDFCNEHGMAMYFTGIRHFRH